MSVCLSVSHQCRVCEPKSWHGSYLYMLRFKKKKSVCPENFLVRKIFLSGKVTFFSKLDLFNRRLRLNETTKGKTKYMSILFIIRRDSMIYFRTIGQKIKRPSPFVWTVFLNVTIVTWLYNSPMKRPRDMKFGVKLD